MAADHGGGEGVSVSVVTRQMVLNFLRGELRQCARQAGWCEGGRCDMGVAAILIDRMACSTKRSLMARKIWPKVRQ
jgi:hypothetical protein